MEKLSARVSEIIDEWRWARRLSNDLLDSLSEETLLERPIKNCGSWGKQFRHLGRVQENYIQALKTKVIKFTPDICSYNEAISKVGLQRYLDGMDELLFKALANLPTGIEWFGEKWSSERHLQALVSHEILHHGQFIIYARCTGLKLPTSWKEWGE